MISEIIGMYIIMNIFAVLGFFIALAEWLDKEDDDGVGLKVYQLILLILFLPATIIVFGFILVVGIMMGVMLSMEFIHKKIKKIKFLQKKIF